MKLKSIKIDGSFPELGTKKLEEALNNNWGILDIIEIGDRYKTYILKELEEDYEKMCEPKQSLQKVIWKKKL